MKHIDCTFFQLYFQGKRTGLILDCILCCLLSSCMLKNKNGSVSQNKLHAKYQQIAVRRNDNGICHYICTFSQFYAWFFIILLLLCLNKSKTALKGNGRFLFYLHHTQGYAGISSAVRYIIRTNPRTKNLKHKNGNRAL